ncbi:hypothetical protein PENSPDRAFT_680834 [Peniophora sp. CONT]|nr:hypothetical protein PENSPDRAFT_680834 [Peniophora sp. CONT]
MAITNWNDPTLLVEQSFDFVKLQHAVFGLYIWELLCGIWFDLHLLRRQQQGSSAFAKWVYLLCRYVPFVGFIIFNVGFDVTSEIDCKACLRSWRSPALHGLCLGLTHESPADICVFGHNLGFNADSNSVTLRSRVLASVAIWDKSWYLIGISAAVLAAETAFFVHEIVVAEAVWLPAEVTCVAVETQRNRLLTTISITDIFLFFSMLTGLLRLRNGLSHSGLWRLLWNQGLIWLLLATIAEVPTVVFLWLNLNQVMNLVRLSLSIVMAKILRATQIFFAPELIILVVGSTRMYRALSTHYTDSVDPSVTYKWNTRSTDVELDDISMDDHIRSE